MPERIIRRTHWKLNIKDGRFTRIGELRTLLGLKAQDLLTIETLSSMVHPDDRDVFHDLFGAPFEKNWSKEGELRIIWKDGSDHALRLIVFPHAGGADAPLIGVAENAIDPEVMEKMKVMQCHLNQAREESVIVAGESQRLMYHLSHDLQAPIRNITGFSQAIMERHSHGLDAKGKDYLHRVVQESGRMNHMIAGLLRMSRIGTRPMKVQTLDLSAIARDKAEIVMDKHQRSIDFLIQEGVGVDADAYMMDVLMEELLDNACKFSMHCADPFVSFGLLDDASVPTVYVRDNGVGFDPDYSGKLFNPFQRLHSEDEFPGIGIGLAIVYAIVRRHGGRIWAESKINEGATFFFTLH
jgi:light-regulated signal transduction histidine kinase (bacteriophytochrome)